MKFEFLLDAVRYAKAHGIRRKPKKTGFKEWTL